MGTEVDDAEPSPYRFDTSLMMGQRTVMSFAQRGSAAPVQWEAPSVAIRQLWSRATRSGPLTWNVRCSADGCDHDERVTVHLNHEVHDPLLHQSATSRMLTAECSLRGDSAIMMSSCDVSACVTLTIRSHCNAMRNNNLRYLQNSAGTERKKLAVLSQFRPTRGRISQPLPNAVILMKGPSARTAPGVGGAPTLEIQLLGWSTVRSLIIPS
jgi:hypothetical protein